MALDYAGGELELFSHANNWKRYFANKLAPFISGRVLEVGAGIGSNIPVLHNATVRAWIAMEPDPRQAAEISAAHARGDLPAACEVVTGTIDVLPTDGGFDTILYVDVLEHIADDRTEVAKASARLAPGGRLVVLAPAHRFLFTAFDRAIGHHRRYDLRSLKALTPAGCRAAHAFMLDSVGFFASLANWLLLRAAMPTPAQIATWDRLLVPLSRIADPMTGFRFGKTAIVVWQREDAVRGV